MSDEMKDWVKILLPMIFIALTSVFSTKQSIAVIEERLNSFVHNQQAIKDRVNEAQTRAIRNSLELEGIKGRVASVERELERAK